MTEPTGQQPAQNPPEGPPVAPSAGYQPTYPPPYPSQPGPPPRRPWAARHRGLLIAAVVVAVVGIVAAAAAAGSGGNKSGKTVAASTATDMATEEPTFDPVEQNTADPTTEAPSGPAAGTFGRQFNVEVDGEPGAGMTVGTPVFDRSFNSGFSTPKHGQFVSFRVTFVAQPGVSFDYNTFEFYVRDAAGAHYDATFDKEPNLASGTLNQRERVTGWVTFDAPRHAALVYAPNLGGTSVAEWRY
jgi:hypothetical protein